MRRRWLTATLRWLPRLALLLVALDIFYLTRIWPDFDALAAGPAPVSAYIQQHRAEHPEESLHWVPVGRRGHSAVVRRVVVAAEDARFHRHYGVDWRAVREAAQENWEAGRIERGASTIT
ncbi:MAG: transglycosylase domain-containing protein, partial [Pseudomonadota bacterium]